MFSFFIVPQGSSFQMFCPPSSALRCSGFAVEDRHHVAERRLPLPVGVDFILCLACRTSHEFASKVPYMVVPGNHEAECHSPACLSSPRRLTVSS